MFRIKLVTAIAVLLLFALTLAAVMVWGAMRAEYDIQRNHLAHKALESYLGFSQEAHRHFKERLDVVLFSVEPDNANVLASGDRMWRAMEELAAITRSEIEYTEGSSEHKEELDELDRVKRLELLIWEGLNTFDSIERLQREGHQEEAHRLLQNALEQTFDERLSAVVDDAVADEQFEVERARQDAIAVIQRLYQLGAGLVVLAVLFAVTVGVLLWRNVTAPINALMRGTRAVAGGDLRYRIDVTGRDEFAELAVHFNHMAKELRSNELQLREAQNLLERKVAQRTAALQHANTRLKRMDEVRRQFFADISHELRTPLTIVRGEAEVTLRGQDKSAVEYQTALRRIVDLAGQLTTLVGDLLFLARAGTQGARLDFSGVDLNDLMLESWEDAQMLARNKQLQVKLDIEAHALQVSGDRMRLKQMMHILIDNACKYSKATIRMGLSDVDGEAVINIHDDGIGIKDNDQAMVFERFYRGDDASQVVPEGSGLGLPLARSIVDAHNGTITVASAEGEGTTFTVRLPVSQQQRLLDDNIIG